MAGRDGHAPEDDGGGERPGWLSAWCLLVEQVAGADPGRRRFGARHHQYRTAPPLTAARLAALEAELGLALPADYRDYLGLVGDGGAGPYAGLAPFDHPAQRPGLRGVHDPTTSTGPWAGVVALGAVGCDQATYLVVRGADAGTVWLDARAAGAGVRPIAPSFAAYLADWGRDLARGEWPRSWAPPGACALPRALSAYLAGRERALGVAAGTLGDAELRRELAAIPAGAIRLVAAGAGPMYADGDLVDPCPACEHLLAGLAGRGLDRAALAPATTPRLAVATSGPDGPGIDR
ncbi:MAG: hypothetical protein KBG28_16390 [Kofleriaceae bacterium]|nr:hypothetical protein [Kofleriaceae bacterium]MBP6839108.1 hypothetical protein [Kofleriaceae bacterium]MBP9205551.1 hypothetical protein [Kofleriaceae bacterium]